ncbi:hypothetical protein [Kocuria sp. CPCC 205263]|uniref:hypothetical protein n=1 Tax=Kocuria sp. CPCC 205263 TaxID=3073555 RepID=UPI0034D791BF
MADMNVPDEDLARLRPGDRLDARRDGQVHHRGVVDATVPRLGVVWIRERSTGYRKMLSTDDFELRSDRHARTVAEHQELA